MLNCTKVTRYRLLLLTLFLFLLFLSLILFIPKGANDYFGQPSPTATPSPTPLPETLTLGLVGDLGLGRYITYTARSKNNFNYSFSSISTWLQSNDLNLANLESPIIENCPSVAHNTFKFCGDPAFLPQLVDNKLIFTLANNHIFNYGDVGFSQTQKYLDQNSISYCYSHTPDKQFFSKNIKGIVVGFLGFDFITNPNTNKQAIINLVTHYRPQVNWLVVSLHWGNEYLPQPENWRLDFAHQLVDAGADIIHGHHPHVWQEYELYNNKLIFYSFGNFIFDQNWSLPTSQSFIVRLTLTKNTIQNIELFPIEIKENCRPEIISS